MALLLLFATPHPDQKSVSVACAVLTVSDTLTSATDKSGQLMQSQLVALQSIV